MVTSSLLYQQKNGVLVRSFKLSLVKTEKMIRSMLLRSLKVPMGRVRRRISLKRCS